MSKYNRDDLEKLFKEWSKLKHDLSKMELREKEIKLLVSDIMEEEKTNILTTENYEVKKRTQNRTHLSQRDIPEDIWKKYAKVKEFSALYLKKY